MGALKMNAVKGTLQNLDDMNDLDRQVLISTGSGSLTPGQLEYAFTRGKAVSLRRAGKISSALHWEEVCETLYRGLPEGLQW